MAAGSIATRSRPPAVVLALLAVGALAACAPDVVRGPAPRRRAAPLAPPIETEPTRLPPDRVTGPTPVGTDVTRESLTARITVETPKSEAMALRLAQRAREELDGGTTTQAIELLDEAIKDSPATIPPYVIRAQAYLAEGSIDRARADLEKAARRDPSAPWLAEVVALNGELLEIEGNQDGAIAAYRRALRISSANQTAREALRRLAP
ncbi:MAG: tetratricopeptide repeat protein [Deltaproteobacteria bacterium]|nr:tetratricopeptide repeat protein [Deltaproteobacteria bacterium]